MMEATVSRALEGGSKRLPPWAAAGLVLIALTLQVFLPLYVDLFRNLDLPLVAVVYLALSSQNVLAGLTAGCLTGLAQDALTGGPLGQFGMIKTIVGYLAASLGRYLELDYPGLRGMLAGLFFVVHQLLYWLVRAALLREEALFRLTETLILAMAHIGLSLVAFRYADRLKRAN